MLDCFSERVSEMINGTYFLAGAPITKLSQPLLASASMEAISWRSSTIESLSVSTHISWIDAIAAKDSSPSI